MNRQLKFRVWSEDLKCFEYFTFKDIVGCDCPDWNANFIQQFTGLKDKNGNEIYEGDILKLTFPNTDVIKKFYKGGENTIIPLILEKVEALTFTGLVTFDGGEGILSQFSYYIDNMIPFWALKSLVSSIEIVGNQFENPELLT
jgi:uncharacterized phage protein (TIGR01671 family)